MPKGGEMYQPTSELPTLIFAIVALWLGLNGIAWMLGGPKAAGKLNYWLLRQIRSFIGGIFKWVGKKIAGK